MKAPDKIYVEIRHPFGDEFTEMLGFESRGNSDDIEYIHKEALVEWLLKGIEMSEICDSEYGDACAQAYQAVVDKINSL